MKDRIHSEAANESTGWKTGMGKRCYYEVLEVERSSSDADLKSAFRKLAMKWHPDRNPGDTSCEHRFKEINEAYEVLRSEERRVGKECRSRWTKCHSKAS